MWESRWGLILAGGFALGAARPAGSLEVGSAAPGHVFIEGEELAFALVPGAGEALPEELQVVDYHGEVVARPTPQEKLVLPALPRGYYELRAGTRKLTSWAVVPDPDSRVPGDSRLATDCAHSWLIRSPDQYGPASELLRRAGFRWVRERLSWGEVEPERGKFLWGKYDQTADEESRRGIRVYQIFHNIPAWARADRNWKAYPDDLRDVFHFARAAAEHFKGRIQAWEIWNEADIPGFSEELGDEYAAFHKAAALGFRAGDPDVKVLMVSLAMGPGKFADDIFLNGIAPYTDIYNWHIYARPQDYPARAQAHLALMARHGLSRWPMWLTEAGIPLRDRDGGLSPEDERRQAEFIPRSYVYSLASGVDKHFWFVFPYYLENGIDFGSLNPDLTPKPGYVALSTITYALGRGDYRGRLEVGRESAHVHVFDRGDGSQAAVCWSEEGAMEVDLPVSGKSVTLLSLVGTPTLRPIAGGTLRLTLKAEPFYLLLPEGEFRGVVPPSPRPEAAKPALTTDLPGLVLRWRFPAGTAQKQSESYVLPANETAKLELQIYNLGTEAFSGQVVLSVPEGWEVHEEAGPIRLAPLDRAVRELSLIPRWNGSVEPQRLGAVVQSGDRRSTPALATVRLDLRTLEPGERLPLELSQPAAWSDNISGNGTMSHAAGPDGGVRFDFRFTAPGDRWAYPFAVFEPPLDLSGYDGLRLEYRCDTEAPDSRVRVQLVEPSGAAYYTAAGFRPGTQWQTATVLFADLVHGSWSPADANGKLDLDRLAALRVGVNTPRDTLSLEVRNIEAVRFSRGD